MENSLINILKNNPALALELIIANNKEAVHRNLVANGIYCINNEAAIYTAIVQLINNDKATALNVLAVPVIAENLPDGYAEELTSLGFLQPEKIEYAGQENQEEDTDTDTKTSSFQWGDFFKFASEVVVGLWGSTNANNHPPVGYSQTTRTYPIIWVVVVIAIVGVILYALKKR